ncbi:dihydrofolate reductase family protein [Arthrobacter sp. TMN-37]
MAAPVFGPGGIMALLLFSGITSLDGYVADENGSFDWGVPDDQVHRFINDLQRAVGTHLYGRRLYEVMLAWETLEAAGQPAAIADFADIWRGTDKIVYSRTLPAVASARTRLERTFDPASVRRLKAEAPRDLAVGGPGLAAGAIRAGLVDEIHQFVSPVVVGAGTRFLPDGVRLDLELLDERRFPNGVVFLRYGLRSAAG